MVKQGKSRKASANRKAAQTTALSTSTPFNALPRKIQNRVASRMIFELRRGGFFTGNNLLTAQDRGGYNSVWTNNQLNRRWITAETEGETGQLTASERNRLISFARNTARNSDRLESILSATARGTIGTEGGKCIVTMPPEFAEAQKKIQKAFAEWASECDYFDGKSLHDMLKWVLRALLTAGDLVLVFDNYITRENTGKVIFFEGDCIGNLSDAEFDKYFEGRTQHQGIIKSKNGQTIGVIVSVAQRGQVVYRLFNDDGSRAAWTLVKPKDTKWADAPFAILRNFHRPNQMRGYSPLWSGLSTISDTADLENYEIQSAKKNAQTLAVVEQGDGDVNEGEIAAELDPDATAPLAVDEEADAPIPEEIEQQRLDLDSVTASGCLYDVLPPSCKMQLLDTPRPNMNVTEFGEYLVRTASWAAGLSSLYATGKADKSYSAAMAEFLLADQTFKDEWKRLEREFLDWTFNQWSKRAQARGEIPQDFELPEDWRRTCIQWARAELKALNPVDEQTATAQGLKNLTKNYHELLGPDWRRKLTETAEELNFIKGLGIPDPRLQTAAGALIPTNENGDQDK
jgi:capsid protein